MPNKTSPHARVIAAHGRHYIVELADGTHMTCFPRGKRSQAAVGDNVTITITGTEGTIDHILERRNLLYRSDDMRTKQFAANVDQLLIVVATQPRFSEELAGRALTAAWTSDIKPLIILNKTDLTPLLDAARQRLDWLRPLNVPIIELSATDTASTCDILLPWLENKTSLLLGQSAMGKSTILNALVPTAQAPTQEHSHALGAGKHTTTTSRLYHLPGKAGSIIDSPGFQAFGLHHLALADIEHGFPEFDLRETSCRFHNCSHRHEPGCAVLPLLKQGALTPQRYELYKRLLTELEAKSSY